MVDSCGRSVSVWVAMVAEARAFGTFMRVTVAVLEVSGMVVAVGSTRTRLLLLCSLDVVIVLIVLSLDLSNEQTNDNGMSNVLYIVLLSSVLITRITGKI